MATASDLRSLLDQTTLPSSGFNVIPIPLHPSYYVGHGAQGSVVVLTPPEATPGAPTSLRWISLAPRIRCQIERDGEFNQVEAGVVEFRDDDGLLIDHFLGVAGVLIDLLGSSPAPGEVSRAMSRLLRLFAAPQGSRASELGVWGELLVMVESDDPAALIASWHARVDDRFDFSAEGARLEVKTTSLDRRVHQFSLPQLLPVGGVHQHVASLQTVETNLGSSVADLVAQLSARLSNAPSAQMRLLEQLSEVLGSDWPRSTRRRFDSQGASDSLRILPASEVPRVEPGPAEVLKVDLTVDVSRVPPLGREELDDAGPLVRLIGPH